MLKQPVLLQQKVFSQMTYQNSTLMFWHFTEDTSEQALLLE
jgi:hypothetical protein